MDNLLTIERTMTYGISLCTARRLTDDEKAIYTPECRELMLIGTGAHIKLPHITWRDVPDRPYDGMFPGCCNQAWIITQEDWDAYLDLEAMRDAAAVYQARLDEIAALEKQKAEAEKQKDLPTTEEAARRVQDWINVHNEGGEGYVPHIYSREEYDRICARLANMF